ncbi:MAG TPA: biotin/lipoyl-containing protein [Vicinamibacterales bacterium]|nr:biotin/lipoyl-containing protein [Vicinamibacterales bacterium]
MTVEVEVGERTRTVILERLAPGRFRVTLDGRPCEVDVIRTAEFGLSLLLDGASGRSREMLVAPGGERGVVFVNLEGRTIAVGINRGRSRRSVDGAPGAGEQVIVAPMPGRVVRLLVRPGDQVAARQGVVVVEAMKMENELRTARPGTVKEIAVAPGASVEAGRVLVVVA